MAVNYGSQFERGNKILIILQCSVVGCISIPVCCDSIVCTLHDLIEVCGCFTYNYTVNPVFTLHYFSNLGAHLNLIYWFEC